MAKRIPVDRAVIFSNLCHRNALRRAARLPLLDLKAEYRRLVDLAKWRYITERYRVAVQSEILARQRDQCGPTWGNSAGGRWMTEILTTRLLRERYWC